MRDLIYILLNNPLVLMLVVVWVLSGLGSAVAKAKRAQQRQPMDQPGRLPGRAPGAPARRAQVGGRPPHSAPQTAEEIARQLREMLGIETVAPPPPPAPAPAPAERDEAWAPHHPEPERGDRDLVPGSAGKVGELHEAMAARRMQPTAVAASVAGHLGHKPTRAAVAAHLRRRPTAPKFDPRRAAAAIVALEVFGPPRALRPYGDERR